MPLLYEATIPPQRRRLSSFQPITEKSFNLLDPNVANPPLPRSLNFGAFGSGTLRADSYVKVLWDVKKTVLNQALLTWTAHKWADFLGDRRIDMRLSVNDVLVSARGWDFGEVCLTKGNPEGLNIGAHLKNGTNKFTIEVVGAGAVGAGGIDYIKADFVAQFQGEEPTVEPAPVTWWEKLFAGIKENAVWIGVGTVAIVGVVVAPKIIEAVRKRKE